MTSCEVCGGEQFSLQDGFYNCDECGTQSQEVREMTLADVITPGVRAGFKISEEGKAARRRSRPPRKADIKRVRLTAPERLNLLLPRWTKRLQDRGAPADLTENMLQLWAYILDKLDGKLFHPLLSTRGALCYLWVALADCDSRYRLSDVFRWARDGTIPVYSAANEIPEDAVANWTNMFRGGGYDLNTTSHSFLRGALRRLSLPAPPRPSLEALLSRQLTELSLPEQLARVAAQMGRRALALDPLTPEVDTLILLLLALKVLLGLDGATELANSRLAAARNAAVPEGARWFDFSAWLRHLRESRAAIGRRDYLSLQREPGLDPCQLHHRRLLYDYYREEGSFCQRVETNHRMKPFRQQAYQTQTASLFSRQAAASAEPPSFIACRDLLRPVSALLPKELLEEAYSLRKTTVDFLVDEKHVRQLDSVGLEVTVIKGAARRRQLRRRLKPDGDVILVDSTRNMGATSPTSSTLKCEAQGDDGMEENSDLCLYLPSTDVWAVELFERQGRIFEFIEETSDWPQTFKYLIKVFSQLVEVKERDFARRYSHMELQVLGPGRGERVKRPQNGNVRRRQSRRNSSSSSEE